VRGRGGAAAGRVPGRAPARGARRPLPRCTRRRRTRARRRPLPRAAGALSRGGRGARTRGQRDAARISRIARRGGAMRRCLALIAVLLAGCVRGRLVRDGQVDRDGLAAVERSIGVIRGRPLQSSVPAVVLDGPGLRGMIAGDIDASYPPGDIERIEAVYTQIGLLPPGTKLRASIEQLYEAEGAAFYDPRKKRLVISSHPMDTPVTLKMVAFLSGRDLAGEMIVAHELTHAIQDQYWGIPTDPDPI